MIGEPIKIVINYNFNKMEIKTLKYIKKFVRKKYGHIFFNKKYVKMRKYKLHTIINEIYYFLKSGTSYRLYRGPIKYRSLNYYINFFQKNNIFRDVYNNFINRYLRRRNLKYLSTDTSFFINNNCTTGRHLIAKNLKAKMRRRKLKKEQYTDINKNLILGKNKYVKNKNCAKLSLISDKNGIPIDCRLYNGAINDARIGIDQINAFTLPYKIKTKYLMADKGYDTKDFRESCSKKFTPIIDYNNRNSKNNIKKLSKEEQKIYKKRISVENSFCYIKKYRRLLLIYEKKITNFMAFIYLALCCIIRKHIK